MQKFAVVQSHRGTRGWVKRGKFTLEQAYKLAVKAEAEFEATNQSAVIEIVLVKDNGHHGDTISKFIVKARG
jgi:hypothetical protein